MGQVSYNSKSGAIIIGGDFQGLGIVRNLAHLGIPIIIVDPNFCIARFSRFADKHYKCPPLTNPRSFTDFLMRLAIKEKLEKPVLFPTSDMAVYILSNYREQLAKYYLIPTPAWEITKFAYDKRFTYSLARELGVPIPKTFFPESLNALCNLDLDFPVILKPSITAHFYPVTKRKAIQANSSDELFHLYKYVASIIDKFEIMVQEVIKGGPRNLYSFCSLFSNGVVKAKIMANRLRQYPMDFGSATTFAITCNIPALEEFATRILRKMNYYGLSEIEFMFDEKDNTFKLLDINSRTWGWHTLGAKAGVNFSSLLFRDMHNESIHVDSFENGVKWVRELTDVPTAILEILKKRLKLRDYLKSVKGKKELAVYSRQDPLPFITELFFAPYRLFGRGFKQKIWKI